MKTKILFFLLFAFVAVSFSFGQKSGKKISITGTVTDVNNSPVNEAVIMIDGKKTGKLTNSKGVYKIKVSPGAASLGVFTFSSGITEEAIDGRTSINFTLAQDNTKVVAAPVNDSGEDDINIGYGTVKRKNLTSSVNKVNARQARYASYNNIYEMLKGELPGVQVNGRSIKIQGASSLMSSTEPLMVVDGVVVNSIDDIMPQMVRSIEVLKGSSASIYGSRGANGVILITLLNASDPR